MTTRTRLTLLQQIQDDPGILRIVLAPRVERDVAVPSGRDRRDQGYVKTLPGEAIGNRTVVDSRRLEGDLTAARLLVQESYERVVIRRGIRHFEPSPLAIWSLD